MRLCSHTGCMEPLKNKYELWANLCRECWLIKWEEEE
jgi:hypothetical protein